MKTTPNPSATKKRRGELVAEPEPVSLLPVVVAAGLAAEVVVAFIFPVLLFFLLSFFFIETWTRQLVFKWEMEDVIHL